MVEGRIEGGGSWLVMLVGDGDVERRANFLDGDEEGEIVLLRLGEPTLEVEGEVELISETEILEEGAIFDGLKIGDVDGEALKRL